MALTDCNGNPIPDYVIELEHRLAVLQRREEYLLKKLKLIRVQLYQREQLIECANDVVPTILIDMGAIVDSNNKEFNDNYPLGSSSDVRSEEC